MRFQEPKENKKRKIIVCIENQGEADLATRFVVFKEMLLDKKVLLFTWVFKK